MDLLTTIVVRKLVLRYAKEVTFFFLAKQVESYSLAKEKFLNF